MADFLAGIKKIREEVQLEQLDPELDELLKICNRLGVRSVLEIGTRFGGTLKCWLNLLNVTHAVSVDLPLEDEAAWRTREAQWRSWTAPGQSLHCVMGRSEAPSSLASVSLALGQWGMSSVDMVFVDGGHSFDQVSRDYLLYGPYASKLVAFHDIVKSTVLPEEIFGVHVFWKQAKIGEWSREIIHQEPDSRGGYGIGVILKDAGA